MKRFLKSPVLLYLIVSLAVNMLTYNGTRLLSHGWRHYDMTSAADSLIPFLPWTIVIYLGCYVFWVVNYGMGCLQDEQEAKRFLCAECMAKLVCWACFLLLPTTNLRPEVDGTGFFDAAMRWLYRTDAADNLFPSIHCLTSWFCVIAVRRQAQIPVWYKAASVVMALAVCLSTLTTRQHVIPDVFAGVLLAELSYQLVCRTHLFDWYDQLLQKLYTICSRKEDPHG